MKCGGRIVSPEVTKKELFKALYEQDVISEELLSGVVTAMYASSSYLQYLSSYDKIVDGGYYEIIENQRLDIGSKAGFNKEYLELNYKMVKAQADRYYESNIELAKKVKSLEGKLKRRDLKIEELKRK